MTRSLRKRHVIMWVVIAISVAVIAVAARVNVPSFAGDQPQTEINK